MKKRLLTAAFFVSAWGAYSQVGVGTLNPDASAQLDIVSTEKGVLLPRVGLKSVTDTETITKGNINSLLVFNIADGNGVAPGYYYWYVDRWMRIVNEEEVIRLDKNTVNISLTVEAGNLLLKDSDGNTVTVPLSEINLPTTIVNNNDGTYTFINEAGETVIIDVPAAVVNQFENIYNDIVNEAITVGGASYNTFEEYLTHVANESVTIGGSEFVTVTGTGTAADPYAVAIKEGAANSMLITNAAGDVEWASLSTIVKANETVTTLVNNNDGTYTYTNEAGVTAIIDVPAAVVNQFENIYNDIVNEAITVGGASYNTFEEYLTRVANESVTIGGSEFVTVTGTGTAADPYAVAIKEGAANSMLITNAAGDVEWASLSTIVKANETVTTVVNNNDGTYTYTNEAGVTAIIDVPAAVVNQFENIYNDIVNEEITVGGASYNTFEEYLTHVANESVTIGGSEFVTVTGTGTAADPYAIGIKEGAANSMLITNAAGDVEWASLSTIVKANETVTTLVNNNDGTYTYTNEAGVTAIIDVPAAVVNQFENIYNDIVNEAITVGGASYNTFEEYLTHVANESVTIGGSEFVTVTGTGTAADPYAVAIKEGATNSMLITNAAGDVEWASLSTIVKANETVTTVVNNNDGTYTYTNEAGVTAIIDVPAAVVNQFENIYNDIVNEEITVGGASYNTFEEYLTHVANESVTIGGSEFVTVTGTGTAADPYAVAIKEGAANSMLITNAAGDVEWASLSTIVKANETVTTLVNNNDGTYTYTNEAGVTAIIDVPAAVVNQFENIYNDIVNEEITVGGTSYNTFEEYLTHVANESVTIGGSEFVTVTGTGTAADPYAVAIKEGAANSMLITNAAGDVEWASLSTIVKANETVTTLVNNNDGTYTYTNEAGVTAIIDVPAAVVNQFENIYNDIVNEEITVGGTSYNTFEEYLTQVANESVTIGGSEFVTVTGTGTAADPYAVAIKEGAANSMLITNAAGDVEWASLSTIIKANETVTTLVNNNDGTYTYTNEAGVTAIIDVPAAVVSQFENIYNDIVNEEITVGGTSYNTFEEYLTQVANESVTIGGSEFVTVTGTGTAADPYAVAIKEGAANSMLITNAAGDVEWASLSTIVKANETVTTIVNNNDGTYTYTNEAGVTAIIDVPAAVVSQFENIYNDIVNEEITVGGASYNTFEEYLTHVANESVTIGGSEFVTVTGTGTAADPYAVAIKEGAANSMLITNAAGDVEWASLSTIVKANETVTTLVNNNDGTYTYTNEAGVTAIIDVPAAVVSQFENIYNDIVNEEITVGGTSYNTFEEYLTQVANESVTIGGSEFVTVTGTGTAADPYAIAIKEGAANSMLITNAAGDVEWASLSTIVKANETVTTLVQNPDGTYTYYNEDQIGADGMPLAGATGTTIDPNMVKTRFNAVANQYEFLDAAGNVIATINMNAANVAYNNAASGLVATNVQAAIDELVNRKADLTSTSGDNSITVTNGTGTTLLNTQLHVTAGGINTLKLADNAVTAAKMNAEGAAAGSVPTATGVNGSVAYKQVPRFFYMPAVIFNTSVLTPTGTTVTRDLYQEYYNQFTGGAAGTGNAVYPIAHGTNGYSVPYNGGLVKNPSAQADIYTYARSEMNYYITYYDTDVFENVTVNDNGEMSYTIKSNAKAASYMNIVFVIK